MSEWRIGELADATGLSVRTLRHYEQVGLIMPSRRTEAGYRIYDEHDVQRLYRICAFKSLGLPLGQIADALETEELGDVMARHLEHVELEAQRLAALRDRLRRLSAHLDERLPADAVVALIEAMTQMERVFSPAQLDRLAARRARLGPEGARRGRRNWEALATLLRAQLEAGAAPSSASVRPLARRARDAIREFTGGDEEMERALDGLRAQAPAGGLAGWDAELLDYLYEALREPT